MELFFTMALPVFYPESEYSRQRNSGVVRLREKRQKGEYSESLHTLPRSGAAVKEN